MAANYVTVTPTLAELISSLPQDEVPIKLRCAICSKLAVNAFRTPCCEQMICENCKLSLPSTCPVCEHTPISAEDCKPNKSLRMTTRAFLKTAEKKRDSLHAKEATPITPVDAKPSATPTAPEQAAPPSEPAAEGITAPAPAQEQEKAANANGTAADHQNAAPVAAEESQDGAPSTDNQAAPSDDQAVGDRESQDKQVDIRDGSNEEKNGDAEAVVEETNEGHDNDNADNQQKSSFPNSFGFGGMNGQFPNMNFGGGDFSQMNQMQMMMAMQNGMAPNGFGFPMMGMPGMNMDPSMMNMYQMNNGFGTPGMDMSMMNGGMGGFNGGAGSEENWNGPQSWNNGQNNYNHPNASGMGNGDYGNFNSGYTTGYNQGNFGPHNNFNDFRGRGFFRGRGRGRGFGNYGRGGYGYGQQGNYQGQNQNYMHQQQQYGNNMMGQGSQGPHTATNVSPGDGEADKNVDEYGRTLRPAGGEPADHPQDGEHKTDGSEPINESGDRASNADGAQGPVTEQTSAIEVLHSGPGGDTDGNAGDSRMRTNGLPFGNRQRGVSFGGMPPPAAPASEVPLNAPKGPKAMRQGLPNTSLLNLRARGYQIPGDETSLSNASNRVQSPTVQSGPGGLATPIDDEQDRRRSRSNSIASSVKRRAGGSENNRDRSRSKSRSGREKERDRSHRERRGKHRDASTSRSPSRSRSREHKDRKRKSHRSEEEEERRHRHRSSKKHYDDEETRSSRDDKHGDRSRSASPAGSRKHSHRSSRKDRDSEKRRDRNRDRDKERARESDEDRDYKRKSSHRSSHRDRDRDGKDRDRKRDRDRDRKDRRSRHTTTEPPTPTEPAAEKEVKEFNPPTGPRGSISKNYSIFNTPKGFEIKGAFKGSAGSVPKGPAADREKEGTRRSSTSTAAGAAPHKPGGLDPHAAEREARNRERLLKETQRLAGLTGQKRRGSAMATEDGGGGGGGEEAAAGATSSSRSRKHRKTMSGRRGGEVAAEEDEEARMKKSEAEREGSRWG